MQSHRGGGSLPSGARRRRRARRPSRAGTDQRPERERPGDLPSLRRRLRTAFAACRRHRPGGQAGGKQGAAQVRRRHRRDELRAQAPLGDQGRSPGQGLLAGQRLYLRDFRRSRRRGHGDRLRPQRRRPDHLRRRPGDPQALRHRRAAERPRLARRPTFGNRQARRPLPGAQPLPVDRHATERPRRSSGEVPRGRLLDADPRRPGGRSAGSRQGPRRHRPADPQARPAAGGALRDPLRRRDHRHRARQRSRRTQRRVPPQPHRRAKGRTEHLGPGRRHRRHRRLGRQRRRADDALLQPRSSPPSARPPAAETISVPWWRPAPTCSA